VLSAARQVDGPRTRGQTLKEPCRTLSWKRELLPESLGQRKKELVHGPVGRLPGDLNPSVSHGEWIALSRCLGERPQHFEGFVRQHVGWSDPLGFLIAEIVENGRL
jgi:hypothetical protein